MSAKATQYDVKQQKATGRLQKTDADQRTAFAKREMCM